MRDSTYQRPFSIFYCLFLVITVHPLKKIIFFVFLVPIPLQPRTLDFSFFCLFFSLFKYLNTRTRAIFTYLWGAANRCVTRHLFAAYLHDFDFNYSRRVRRQCSFQTYQCGSSCGTHCTSWHRHLGEFDEQTRFCRQDRHRSRNTSQTWSFCFFRRVVLS